MAIHTLILENGRTLTSGAGVTPAIRKVTLTEKVNNGEAFAWGSVCAACLQVSLFCPEEGLPLSVGQRAELRADGQPVGLFWVDTVERTGKGLYQVTAYDALSQLDRDITPWLENLSFWPHTLQELADMTCSQCGLSLQGSLPNGEHLVGAFRARQVTGRQLLRWIAQAAGCFCRATPTGQVEFGRYALTQTLLRPRGEAYYFRGSYSWEAPILPVDQVQLRQDGEDVGTLYPADAAGQNVYAVEGNPLLQAENATYLEEIAKNLWESLEGITYAPGKVAVPAALQIAPGQIISIEDAFGVARPFYVMERVRTGGKDTLSCYGIYSREKALVSNRLDVTALHGKLLHLQMDVDGVLAQNADAAGNMAQLQLQVEGIQTQVLQRQEDGESLKSQLSLLEQNSQKLEIRLSQVEEGSAQAVTTHTGYRFDADGLWISKSGEEMENRLDHTGMYVRRGGQNLLQANAKGVEATDVTVRNYLHVGEYARLEDYSNAADPCRTACFWIGGSYADLST